MLICSTSRKKQRKSVTLNQKKVTKSNKMEAVIRIFRITAGLIVGPSYSDQETVTVLQTMYKHQDGLIAPKMLYLFPVTGILPQTVVSNSGYLVSACAGGCMTKMPKEGTFSSVVSRNLSHDRCIALNYQCYYSCCLGSDFTRIRTVEEMSSSWCVFV